ncbi:MAG: hypothetical protein ACD_39C01235G0001 [uncultured bacterium]|nr:MAG: hypothetical protein ACD_39C01235G0001 [uncultured bacterium]
MKMVPLLPLKMTDSSILPFTLQNAVDEIVPEFAI